MLEQPIDLDCKAKLHPQESPKGDARQSSGRLASEDAIWRSKVSRKGVAGDMAHAHVARHIYRILKIFKIGTYATLST